MQVRGVDTIRRFTGRRRYFSISTGLALPIALLLVLLLALFGVLLCGVFGGGFVSRTAHDVAVNRQSKPTEVDSESVPERVHHLQVPFVKNSGQIADPNVRFNATLFSGMAFVTDEQLIFSLRQPLAKEPERLVSYAQAMERRREGDRGGDVAVFGISFVDENNNPMPLNPSGRIPSATKVSSFKREQKNGSWNGRLEAYQSVELGQVWENISVELKAYGENLEQLFHVTPGGNPEQIALRFDGVTALGVDKAGELVIRHAGGNFSLTTPVAYQTAADGNRVAVQVAYSIENGNRVGFSVGEFDSSKELIIDPLLASTYLGGTDEERFAYDGFGGHIYTGHKAIARDTSGNVYVVSQTRSNDYPTTPGVYDQTYNDASSYLKNDIVVSKLSANLDTLLASTYLGGTGEDNPTSLAIDASGNIYVAGVTRSLDFPTVSGNLDISYNGGQGDAFIAKLSADLTQLEATTYIGGSDYESIYSILLDSSGHLYATGDTQSANFPSRTGGYQTSVAGNSDAFVLRLTTDLTTLASATFIGGSGDDFARALVQDTGNNVVVVGNTASTNYPTTGPAYDTTHNGAFDVFVSKLSQDLSTLSASTYIGADYDDLSHSIQIDSIGNVIVSGMTESPAFPTTAGAYSRTYQGVYDAFVLKLSANLQTLSASTFTGGNNWEDVYTVGVNATDQIYVAGLTRSSDYPVTSGAYQTTLSGTSDGFISRFSSDLTTLAASTFLGGSGNLDGILDLTFDAVQNPMFVGVTNSPNFPTTPSAYSSSASGNQDMVVFRLTPDLQSDSATAHLVVTTSLGASSTALVAGESAVIRISVQDGVGNILPSYHGDYSVTLSGPTLAPYNAAPTCTDKNSTPVAIGSPTLLTFSQGVASCTVRLYKAQAISIDASITSTLRSHDAPSYDLDVTVTAGAFSAASSMLSATPAPVSVGQLVTLSLVANDLYGNPLGATGAGKTTSFSITGVNPATIGAADNANGTYSGSYTPVASGHDLITATMDAIAVGSDTQGTRDGTFDLTVNSQAADRLEVRYESPPGVYNTSAAVQAGVALTLRLFVKDASGNYVTGFSGDKSLVFSGASVSPTGGLPTCTDKNATPIAFGSATTVSFVEGKASCVFKATKEEAVSIDASEATANSLGAANYDLDVTVSAAALDHYELSGSGTQTAGSSQVVTITAKDQFGNIISAYDGDYSVTFTGASTSYNSTAPTITNKSGVPIAFGGGAVMTFADGVATTTMTLYARESASITAPGGSGTGSYPLNVAVSSTGTAAPAQSTLSSSANPAGNCGTLRLTVVARDLYGNQVESGNATVVVTITGVNSGTPVVVDNGDGSYFATYTPTNSGADDIAATIDAQAVLRDLDGTADGVYHQTVTALASSSAVWTGGTSTFWHVASNWQGGVVPTSCHDVVIDGGYTNAPTIDHAVSGVVTVKSLALGTSTGSVLTTSNGDTSTKYLVVREAMHVGPFGTVTHTANASGDTILHSLYIRVLGDLTVDSGGAIDVSAKGYPGGGHASSGFGPGGGGYFGNGSGNGGSHGGGGSTASSQVSNSTLNSYGSTTAPIASGSSGAGDGYGHYGGSGGGSIRLQIAGMLIQNGSILAAGETPSNGNSPGGGAGGSVWIDAQALGGSGLISTIGGNRLTSSGGGGGGGRIAVTYGASTFSGVYAAHGGIGYLNRYAGAGTIYTSNHSHSDARLIVDNNNHVGEPTYGQAADPLVLTNLLVRNGGYYRAVFGQAISVAGTDLTANGGYIRLDSGSSFSANQLSSITGLTLYNYTTLSLPSLTTMSGVTVENHGIYNHGSSTLTIGAGSTWVENGTLATIGNSQPITDIVVNGTMEFRNQTPTVAASFDTVTINNSGVLTHAAASATPTSSINIRARLFTVNAGGVIDLAQRGYLHAIGSGLGLGPGGGKAMRGASHGGVSGYSGNQSNTYDTVGAPIHFGSSGSQSYSDYAGNGGGALQLTVVELLKIAGLISADGGNGAYYAASGSGGSLLIDAGTIEGSGTLRANGGQGGGGGNGQTGGGGGRIAIHSNHNNFIGDISTFGMLADADSYPSPMGAYAGAGTIYLKDKSQLYGMLIVDNNGHSGGITRGVPGDNLFLSELVIRNGGYYEIVSGQSVTLLASSISAPSGTLQINSGGSFIANSLASLSNLRLINYSTLSLPSISTMSNTTFENHGVYNHNSSTLAVGSGSTWIEDGTLPTIGDSQAVTDLVVNGTLEFRNQTTTNQATFNSIAVNSGGMITHTAGSTTPTGTINLQANSLTIAAGGRIDVAGRGYYSAVTNGNGYGPGYGIIIGGAAGGGTHAGLGGATSSYLINGSIVSPSTFGSSGACGNGSSGSGGGGVVNLRVVGALVNDGQITSNGIDGSAGAGAGGSILISCNALSGGGTITADGGRGGGPGNGGGGGGGRIAISYSTNNASGRISAYGGLGYSSQNAGAGTIYLKDNAQALGTLLVNNNSQIGQYTGITPGDNVALSKVTATAGGIFRITPTNSITSDLWETSNNGRLELSGYNTSTKATLSDIHIKSGGNLSHEDNSTAQNHILNLIADNLTIDAGGTLSVNSLGYDAGYGPGTSSGNSGAGYGGNGANGTTGAGGGSYGNTLLPTDLGSGALGSGAGGGAMRVQIDNTLTLAGTIQALGAAGASNLGGGSGGSIVLTANNLIGNGFITANGGNGLGNGGGGAGGRIAVYYDNQTFLPSGGHITSATPGVYTNPVGGSGLNTGGTGTLYIAAADHITVTGNATQEAGVAQTISLTLIDDQGNPYIWDGTRTVTLSGGAAASNGNPATCIDRLGNAIPLGAPLSVNFTNGVATCALRLYATGSYEIDATDGVNNSNGNANWDLNITVAGGASQPGISYSTLSANTKTALVGQAITATLSIADAFGNPLTSGGQTVVISVSGANSGTPAVSDLGNGTYTIGYTANNTGQDRLTATINGAPVLSDTDGVADGVFHLMVLSDSADHLVVSGSAAQYAGAAQTIVIHAATSTGDLDNSYEGVKAITLTGPSASPSGAVAKCRDRLGNDIAIGLPTQLDFANGQASCQLFLYKVETVSVDASDGTLSSAANASYDLDVTVSIASSATLQGRISASPTTAVESDLVTITVQATDGYGNNWNRVGATVTVSVTGANTASPAVTDNANGTYAASYTPVNVGTDQIVGTIDGTAIVFDSEATSNGVFHLPVLAFHVPHHFEVTGAGTQVAGDWQTVTLTAKSSAGNTAPSYRGAKVVTLSGATAAPNGAQATCRDKFGADIAVGTAMSVEFTNGVASCHLYLYRTGANALDVTDGTMTSSGDASWDLDVVVSGGALDNTAASLTGSATSLNTKGNMSLLVQARDVYENDINAPGQTVVLNVAGANAQVLVVADNGDGTYSAAYEARAPGADVVSGTFNGQVFRDDNEGTSDGVFHATITDTIVADHLTITGNGTQEAGSVQTVTIRAVDAAGYVDYGYSGNKSIVFSGASSSNAGYKPSCTDRNGSPKPFGISTSLSFTNGQANCSMVLYKAESISVDVRDNALNSYANASWDLDVVVSSPIGEAVTTEISATPNPAVVGGAIVVTARMSDLYGNLVYTPGAVVTLTVSGANPQTLTVTDGGDGNYTASYTAMAQGTDLITGAVDSTPIAEDIDGLSDGTFHEVIAAVATTTTTSTVPVSSTTSTIQTTSVASTSSTSPTTSTTSSVATTSTVLPPDSDGDGVTDEEELATGTNPNDPGSKAPKLRTVICSEWNGYLGGPHGEDMYNIMEHVNLTGKKLLLKTELRNILGHIENTAWFPIRGNQQFDVLVHEMSGREVNSYGQVCTTYENSSAGSLDGRMMYYKFGADKSIQFAFALPFENPIIGQSALLFNTRQPSLAAADGRNLVANWVQLSNVSNRRLRGKLYFHKPDGVRVSKPVDVNLRDGARSDYSAHSYGANLAGLVRFVPSDKTVEYSLREVRYLYDNAGKVDSFTTAYPFNAMAGNGETMLAPVDTRSGSATLEVANTLSKKVSVSIKVYDQTGKKVLYNKVHDLEAYNTFHLPLVSILFNAVGVVEVDGSHIGSILGSVLHYERQFSGAVKNMYAVDLREPVGKVFNGSYNTYLNQGCNLYLANASAVKETVQVSLKGSDGKNPTPDFKLPVPARGATVVDLCSKVIPNTYGVVTVKASKQKRIYGVVVRIGDGSRYKVATAIR